MRKILFLLTVSLFLSCYKPNVYTYNCSERNISFKIIEADSFDVLVVDESDSIYLSSAKGQYIGLQFHISEDSDIIYFEQTNHYPFINRYVENKYMIKLLELDYIYGEVQHKYLMMNLNDKELKECLEALNNHHYWGIYGGCDQGRYTFGLWHDSLYMGTLEPLEWK